MVWVAMDEINWESVPGPLILKPQDEELEGNVLCLCAFETLDGEDPMLDGCTEMAADSEESAGLRGITTE